MTPRTILVLAASALPAPLAIAQSLDQSRAFANELYADSSTRTSALEQEKKSLAPKVGGFVMFRYNVNQLNNQPPGVPNTVLGFQSAYTKLQITGNIIDDSWSYGIQVKFNEFDGVAVLDDAWGSKKFDQNWSVKWGQFKFPVLREENISDTKQLSANRSVTNSVFSAGRSQGFVITYAADDFRISGGFGDGQRTNNTDYTAANESDFGITGRGEYKFAGEWKQYDDFTSFRGSKFFGVAGGAAHFQSGGHTVGTTDQQLLLATADVMVKGDGWNAYAAAIYRNVQPTAALRTTDDFGFIAQGGIFIHPQVELFGRYDVVVADESRTTNRSFNTITAGANAYLIPDSHAAKFTADVLWMLDRQNASIVGPSTLTGALASAGDSQLALQMQFQLVF